MDFSQKKGLKSVSLNSRFLGTGPATANKAAPLALRTSSSIAAGQGAPASSKLKLGTSKPSLSLRLSRDQSASPAAGAAPAGTPKEDGGVPAVAKEAAADKKPVWATGAKASKDYTDEELKAVHGISLVTRKSDGTARKEARWDDSDEDDDWGDTIDFGDGVKRVVGKTAPPQAQAARGRTSGATPVVSQTHVSTAAIIQPMRQQKEVQPTNTIVPVPIPSAPKGPPANPWRKPEPAEGEPVPVRPEFPVPPREAIPQKRPSNDARQSNDARAMLDESERGYRRRLSSVHGMRPRFEQPMPPPSGPPPEPEVRYEYDKNDFSRRWQGPQPENREIFNSSTGRFEQVPPSGPARGAMRRGKSEASMEKPTIEAPPDAAPVIEDDPADTSLEAQERRLTRLDPSSKEYIDLQKLILKERRELAIQRRKQEEDEDVARKARARKKAEELAAQAEAEAARKREAEAEKQKKSQPTQILKHEKTRAPEAADDKDIWRRPQEPRTRLDRSMSGTFSQSPNVAEKHRDGVPDAKSFGPIGPRRNVEKAEYAPSSESWLRQGTVPSAPTWNAFDGLGEAAPINENAKSTYRVFDSADVSMSKDKPKHSSPSQAQSSRTSSRFFPNPSTQTSPTKNGLLPERPAYAAPEMSKTPEGDAALFASKNAFEKPRLRIPKGVAQNPGKASVLRQLRRDMRHYVRQIDAQSRSHWESMPLKEGRTPRIRTPTAPRVAKLPPAPTGPVWNMPKSLEVESRPAAVVAEPLVPPPPSLKLPTQESSVPVAPPSAASRRAQEKIKEPYAMSRRPFDDYADPHAPVNVKTSADGPLLQVARRFGRRYERGPDGKGKKNINGTAGGNASANGSAGGGSSDAQAGSIKRQPKNMADHGQGMTRGFAPRPRKGAPASNAAAPPSSASSAEPTNSDAKAGSTPASAAAPAISAASD